MKTFGVLVVLLFAQQAYAQTCGPDPQSDCTYYKQRCVSGGNHKHEGAEPEICDCEDVGQLQTVAPGGACLITASNACVSATCNANQVCVVADTNCDDGNACTTDSCSPTGGCQHAAITCAPPDACSTASCNPSVGCQTTPVVCNDGNACTTDSCNPSVGCQHAAVACTAPDACSTASCNPSVGCQTAPLNCDDGNACTTDSCNAAAGGCQHAGMNCDDGNACTTDTCASGMCSHTNTSGGMACQNMCIAANKCCTSQDCSGGQVCPGPGDSCICPNGGSLCNGTCIAPNTCCDNNCGTITNGTATCPVNGQKCVVTCTKSTDILCGSTCAQCCQASDCPAAGPHEVAVCNNGTCGAVCDGNSKVCGAGCIPKSSCCGNSDCVNTTNPCMAASGTCNTTTGMCSFANSSAGTSCNADNDYCKTPHDTCVNGACVADTGPPITCVPKDCNTVACNTSTGDCVYTPKTGTVACGNNGCSSTAGMCKNGTCSAPPLDCTKDTTINTDCTAGVCDPTATTPTCVATPVKNGTQCTATDRCQEGSACSAGKCEGQAKACTPSGQCRVSMCDSTAGDCVETIAGAASPCEASCTQNATCDSSGDCHGDLVPDGAPCNKAGCTLGAVCGKGVCACVGTADFAGGIELTDAGTGEPVETHKGGSGCAIVSSSSPSRGTLVLLLGLMLVTFVRRRRRHAQLVERG